MADLIIYESKDKRVFVSDTGNKNYSINVQAVGTSLFFEQKVCYPDLTFSEAEKKVKTLAQKAKKLTTDEAIQKFLIALKGA